MNRLPQTRVSLIVRLPGGADVDAWMEFADIYEPFVYRFARRHGLQDADARELVQEVFLGVAGAIRRWQPDPERGRFSTWLFRIARNQLVDLLRRRRSELVLDSVAWKDIDQQHAATEDQGQQEQAAYRQEVFLWASDRVQRSVHPRTWQAFWSTCVEQRSIQSVAEELDVPRGAVYVARSRVISRLQQEVRRFEIENT